MRFLARRAIASLVSVVLEPVMLRCEPGAAGRGLHCDSPGAPQNARACFGPCILLVLLAAGAPAVHGQERGLDQVLDLSLADLLNLQVVTALKDPSTINQVPATIRVVTAEQIGERGSFTLEDVLADLPGFQFRDIQGFNSYVFMRGVPSQNNKILLLLDGIQVNELNSGGFYGGGQFDLAALERIEIAYGPASCLYGTNAVSGVINLITRAPENSAGGRVGLLAGSFDTRAADLSYGAHQTGRRLGFFLSAMYKHTDKGDLKGREGDGNWTDALDNFENDASFGSRVRTGDLVAGFDIQDKDASRATVQKTAGTALSDHDVNWHIRFLNGWASYAYDRKNAWSIRSTAYFRNSTVLPDSIAIIELPQGGSAGRQLRYYRPGQLLGSEARLHWSPTPRTRLAIGLVLERERLSQAFSISASQSALDRPSTPSRPPSLTNDLLSVYAQGQIRIAKMLDLFLGFRHDQSSYYGGADTPRLGLVLNRGRLTGKLLYMEAFRAPKPWDFTDGVGNPDLRPEAMRSYEASGAWSFSEHLRLDVSAFHNRLDGLLTRTSGAEWHWVNAGELKTDGTELGLEYRRGAVKALASYSYSDSRDEKGDRVAEIALHGATAGFALSAPRWLVTDVRARYLGGRTNPSVIPTTGDDRIDAALILDATSSFQLPRGLTLRLSVDNLTNTEYYHPSNLPPSRYRQPQRGFRLKVEYAF